MNRLTRHALIGAAAIGLVAGASSLTASAAPLAANAELKAAVTSNTVEVQRRWRHRRGAIALGAFGVGVVAGAAIANSNRGYYDPGYGYSPEGYYDHYTYYQQPYGYYGSPYADPYGGNY
jgi:hypothetical protein